MTWLIALVYAGLTVKKRTIRTEENESSVQRMMPLFNEEERQITLGVLLGALKQDERLDGVILVGSAAEGFDDRFSDIDLTVVVADHYPVGEIYSAWKKRIARLLPVVSSFEVNYAENKFLGGFLLDNFLELDIGFLNLRDLFA